MLRRAVLALALIGLISGALLCSRGYPVPGVQLLLGGAITALALAFERWRYHAPQRDPNSGWTATGERFEDPQSGQILDVEFHPATGQRRYVPASPPRT